MPVIDGVVVRSRYTKLDLRELSSVDNPAQPGALAAIMKRADPAQPPAQPSILALSVAKYVDSDDGAHTFTEVLNENEFDEKVWPMVSALSQSIRSIMGDRAIAAADRETKVSQSVDEFLAAVREISPAAEKKLAELISKRNPDMTELEKANAKVAELTGQLTSANALVTSEKARADTAEKALETEQAAHGETKKAFVAATDETITVEGTEIKKSAVGEAQFTVVKVLQQQAQTASLEKRASESYAHLTGTTAEKAKVLGAIEKIADEDVRKAATAILDSAEKMASGGFRMIGAGGEVPESVTKALGDFNGKVAEIQKRDGIAQHEAMRKAREEHPDLFQAYREASDEAANAAA
jgi:hypothetical protein